MDSKGMSVTPDEIQALVRKQASLIGSLQTQKMLLEARVERLEAALAARDAQGMPEAVTEPLVAPEDPS